MKNQLLASVLLFPLFMSGCVAQKNVQTPNLPPGKALAFPGAEGFGKFTTGGRGGKIFVVNNLNNDGPGSFREAVEAKLPRIIVFAVSGTIHLETKLNIKGNVTIAGQSAPGDGICLADNPVALNGDNIIVRYLRFRMGDKYQKGGLIDGNGADDAFGGTHKKNIIIDHCSISWSTDEAFSIYSGDSTTLQWNLISEPLNFSYHFEEGDKNYEQHGYGAIWGGAHLSAHHNLFAHCNSRNPRFNGTRTSPNELVDYRNNVIYDWGSNNVYAGEGGEYNLVNNYYKYGPSTKKSVMDRIVNPFKEEKLKIPFGKFYVVGNYVDGSPEVSADNTLGVHLANDGTAAEKKNAIVYVPFPSIDPGNQSAKNAYDAVLKYTGASFRRDTLDERIINDVKNRTGGLIDVQGGFPHGTDYNETVNAWPFLKSLPAKTDTDKDGVPDEWEKKNGLNGNDASDANMNTLNKNYSNIEMYFNSLLEN